VLELQPQPYVSIIDTDVEAEVGPSLETEQYVRQRQEQVERQQQYLREQQVGCLPGAALAGPALLMAWPTTQAAAPARRAGLAMSELPAAPTHPSPAPHLRRPQEQQEREEQQRRHEAQQVAQRAEEEAAAAAAQREVVRRAKEGGLPPEAEAGCGEPLVACLFRLPDGGRASRRVLLGQPLQLLFDYVDSIGAGGLAFGGYQLVAQYPRRVFGPGSGASSLLELGFSSGQEVLLLEPASASRAE
jgi:ubiquitin fusion degradation protein 1